MLHDGVFHAAELLYGLTLHQRPTCSATTPTSGSGRSATPTAPPVGLFLGDFYAREGKRGGAWMSTFVRQSRLLGTRPVVVNNLNVPAAAPAASRPC